MRGTIIYAGGFELPDKNAAAHRVIANAKILKKIGYNVVFVSPKNEITDNKNLVFSEILGFEAWEYPKAKGKLGIIRKNFEYKYLLETVKKYNDITAIILYNYPSFGLFNVRRYSKKKDIKLIGDITEWYQPLNPFVKLDSFLRMRYLNKKMDGLICISTYLTKHYKKNISNIITVPPLIDKNDQKWNELSRHIKKSNDNKIHLIYAGSPGRKDKIKLIIESIEGFNNLELSVIGLNKKDIKSTIPNNVTFHGRLSHSESLVKLKYSDFSIFIREVNKVSKAGFPTKFVESISMGIPVITNNTSDLLDYFEDDIGYLIPNYSKKELIKIFETIDSNGIEISKKMKSILIEKKDSFDICKYEEKFIDFVKGLCI
ncbi:glycosyltransferase [Acholeplasma equirhinis]|uniref:glycosyltransferase n=1 Tax=Acholeplasma equirhinis TaxID=555393 RepID=UPI00197AB783|nr:glycosyltransferase [Acholeplasma equirhinis]MBN3489972.1 glycosyltransferase [Acholeplasma equirhinis]